MSEQYSTPDDTQASTDPYIIRGHHSNKFFQLVAQGKSPEEVVASTYTYDDPATPTHYKTDVWGPTQESATETNQSIQRVFETFLALPDAAPVRLVMGQRDGICDSCHIGKHCSEVAPRGDLGYVRAFIRTAGALGLEGNISIENETATTKKGSVKQVIAVSSTAQTARAIFADPHFHGRQFRFSPIRKLADKLAWQDEK